MNTLKKPILVYRGGNDSGTTDRFDAIRDAMNEVFCYRYAHGHSAGDVFSAAIAAERWCAEHGLRVKDRAGMIVIDTSSKGKLPAKYNHKRIVTDVKLVRKARGWYLVAAGRDELWPSEKGGTGYWLTPAQDQRVKEWLWRQYAVQAPKAEGEE